MNYTLKNIVINAMGIALFVVLSLCLQVPVFQNYYLCIGYVAMTVFSYNVGVRSGTIVGTFGVVIYCVIINGMRGMPGWAIGNLVIGIIIGLTFKFTKRLKKPILEIIISSFIAIISTAIAILIVKSFVEYYLYLEPFLVRVASNMYAFIADAFVITISIPIAQRLNPILSKYLKVKDIKSNNTCLKGEKYV